MAHELGFNRTEIGRFHAKSAVKGVQAKTMLESWYSEAVCVSSLVRLSQCCYGDTEDCDTVTIHTIKNNKKLTSKTF